MSVRPLALTLLLPFASLSQAADSPPQQVEIKADGASRRAVGRSSVQRSELLNYGDSSLAEALKRQPGISVVGAEVRMRGLGAGYTAILIDGEPAPQGFTLDAIAPELVERIDILRSATAEQSTQAVAGSINIILRHGAKGREGASREDTLALGLQHGRWSGSAATQHGARSGGLAWSLNATLERNETPEHMRTSTRVERPDGTAAQRRNRLFGHGWLERLSVAPRLDWALDAGAKLSWQTLATLGRSHGGNRIDEVVLSGPGTDYPDNGAVLDARMATLRSELAWERRLAGGGKLNASVLFDANRRGSDYLFQGRPARGGPGIQEAVDAGVRERLLGVKGKYLLPLGAAHTLGMGWDLARTVRNEHRHQFDSYLDGPREGLRRAPLLQDYRAVIERLAWFAQDEWEVGEQVQAYAGVRWEGLRTSATGRDLAPIHTSSSVFSPVAQLLWKLPARRQLRVALARTYKAPLARELVPRRYTVNNGNNAVNPDIEGNPALLPELSWGLDAAYERPFLKGTASVSGYARRISNVTAQALMRDGASWVARPVNDGAARTAGIELDLKTPLSIAGAQVDLRFNAARNWSRVTRVPGPDNRLADQVPLTVNLGLDHRNGAGWSAGANLNLQGGAASLASSGVWTYRGTHSLLDVYWSRKFAGAWTVRLAGANLLGRDRASGANYRDGQDSYRRVVHGEGWASVRVTLKRSL